MPQRLDAVLEAIYAAFGIGWDDMAGVDQRGRDLAEEAIWLARVLLQLMPRGSGGSRSAGSHAPLRSPQGGAAGAGRPVRSSLGAGLPEVVAALN